MVMQSFANELQVCMLAIAIHTLQLMMLKRCQSVDTPLHACASQIVKGEPVIFCSGMVLHMMLCFLHKSTQS